MDDPNELTKELDRLIELITEMKEMLDDGGDDAVLGFFEAMQDAHQYLARINMIAVRPIAVSLIKR